MKPSSPNDRRHACYEHRWTCDRCHICQQGECCENDHPRVENEQPAVIAMGIRIETNPAGAA